MTTIKITMGHDCKRWTVCCESKWREKGKGNCAGRWTLLKWIYINILIDKDSIYKYIIYIKIV
jgi:hypothetical protein